MFHDGDMISACAGIDVFLHFRGALVASAMHSTYGKMLPCGDNAISDCVSFMDAASLRAVGVSFRMDDVVDVVARQLRPAVVVLHAKYRKNVLFRKFAGTKCNPFCKHKAL